VVMLSAKQSDKANNFSASLAEIKHDLKTSRIHSKELESKTIHLNCPHTKALNVQNADAKRAQSIIQHMKPLSFALKALNSSLMNWARVQMVVPLIGLTRLDIMNPEMCGGRR